MYRNYIALSRLSRVSTTVHCRLISESYLKVGFWGQPTASISSTRWKRLVWLPGKSTNDDWSLAAELAPHQPRTVIGIYVLCCKPGTMNIVQFLVYDFSCFLQRNYTTLRRWLKVTYRENPCWEPPTFYTDYCPFHSLASSLRLLMQVGGLQAKHGPVKTPCREPIRFYAFSFNPTFARPVTV
jgi:hypothetical protein